MAFTADKVRQGVQKDTGYSIDNSLRFNDNDSANLTWLQGTGNRRTWTWSGWVKRGNLTSEQPIITWQNTSENSDWDTLEFSTTDTIRYYMSGASSAFFVTNQVFRDTSAWYHICLAVDTTQATASNRVKLYVNGEQVTSFSTATYPSQNYDTWTNLSGRYAALGSNIYADTTFTKYLDGYLSEVNFIDGQALTPDNFGETGDYGEWKPIEYTGTYGTNGFYLDFSNSGSLGTDASSNTNNWTVNNLAATDQMLDSPTNNFCTLNPLSSNTNATLSEGSLRADSVGSGTPYRNMAATFSVSSGKWYYEWAGYSLFSIYTGFATSSFTSNAGISEGVYYDNYYGKKRIFGTGSAYGATWTSGDVIGIAIDVDSNSVTFYKNGVSQGSFSYTDTEYITPMFVIGDDSDINVNFGQDSSFAGNKTAQGNQDSNSIGDFYYEPPTDFLALCTSNLPDPAVVPSEHFNTVTYTGTENASVHGAVTGVGFQPDMIWFKNRNFSYNNAIYDALRGTNSYLVTNSTGTEVNPPAGKDLTSFDSDGFSLGTSWGAITCGKEGSTFRTYVAWNWKAGGTGVSNTNGSITSTVSANADAGFSIVSYTGTGSNATIGHGLSKAPEMLIIKNRDQTDDWIVYHEGIGNTSMLRLNTSGAKNTYVTWWNNTSPTSTVFTVSTEHRNNASSEDYIAYCFHSVDGYSKMGSYTGNDSSDGTFIYTGFRPKYLLVKRYDSGDSWFVFDDGRDDTNVVENYLSPDLSSAETNYTLGALDFVSNGVKMRKNNGQWNGATNYIYLAFAEYPFKHTNAR